MMVYIAPICMYIYCNMNYSINLYDDRVVHNLLRAEVVARNCPFLIKENVKKLG